jgi:hypothetical protein
MMLRQRKEGRRPGVAFEVTRSRLGCRQQSCDCAPCAREPDWSVRRRGGPCTKMGGDVAVPRAVLSSGPVATAKQGYVT